MIRYLGLDRYPELRDDYFANFTRDLLSSNMKAAARIDQHEGLLGGTDDTRARIIGRPLMTIEEFIKENHSLLS